VCKQTLDEKFKNAYHVVVTLHCGLLLKHNGGGAKAQDDGWRNMDLSFTFEIRNNLKLFS